MKKIVKIKKDVLLWAFEEANIPFDYAVQKRKFISAAFDGEAITVRQAEELSNFLKVPLGYLLLTERPVSTKINADFRTIGNKKNNAISKDLKDVLFSMDYKKNWMSEYKRNNNYEKFELQSSLLFDDDFELNVKKVREVLNLSIEWFNNSVANTFELLKEKVENTGVIVMESGIVGQNTKRTLDINEFRGFALNDDYAPLIFINASDKSEARCFTLLHEFIHLLINKDDDILFEENSVGIERKINRIVAEILMPENFVREYAKNKEMDFGFIKKISSHFKVSLSAICFRLFELNLISKNRYDEFNELILSFINRKSGGGNFYSTFSLRTSKTFSCAVYDSVYKNNISFSEAYSLLGIKGKTFLNFKESLYARG